MNYIEQAEQTSEDVKQNFITAVRIVSNWLERTDFNNAISNEHFGQLVTAVSSLFLASSIESLHNTVKDLNGEALLQRCELEKIREQLECGLLVEVE